MNLCVLIFWIVVISGLVFVRVFGCFILISKYVVVSGETHTRWTLTLIRFKCLIALEAIFSIFKLG